MIIDGNQLLYHIPWPSPGTGSVGVIAESMKARIQKYVGTDTYILFDQYRKVSGKDHER